jgi:hypothetical protein
VQISQQRHIRHTLAVKFRQGEQRGEIVAAPPGVGYRQNRMDHFVFLFEQHANVYAA